MMSTRVENSLFVAVGAGFCGAITGALAMADRAHHLTQFHDEELAGRVGLFGAEVAILGAFTLAALALGILVRVDRLVGGDERIETRRNLIGLLALLWPVCFFGPIAFFWDGLWEWEFSDKKISQLLFIIATIKVGAWISAWWKATRDTPSA